ncbi:MAG: hypothetical protein RPU34_10400 [Candidatus Sedimenticola sp. (ex Thyasira tokunagai)]
MCSLPNFTAVSGIHGTTYGEEVLKPLPACVDAIIYPYNVLLQILKFLYATGLLRLISPKAGDVFADHHIKQTVTGGGKKSLIAVTISLAA